MKEAQQNNPLHGLKLETLVTELVDFYGWKILYAAMKLACFNNNPSVEASIIFLKKTEWAREKVENFYLYRFKRMPKAVGEQFALKPRERGFAAGITPGDPMVLTLESIAKMQAAASAEYEAGNRRPNAGYKSSGARSHSSGQSADKHSGYSAAKRLDNGNARRSGTVKSGNPSAANPSTDDNDPWGTKRG